MVSLLSKPASYDASSTWLTHDRSEPKGDHKALDELEAAAGTSNGMPRAGVTSVSRVVELGRNRHGHTGLTSKPPRLPTTTMSIGTSLSNDPFHIGIMELLPFSCI
jgi:hypothetical protein